MPIPEEISKKYDEILGTENNVVDNQSQQTENNTPETPTDDSSLTNKPKKIVDEAYLPEDQQEEEQEFDAPEPDDTEPDDDTEEIPDHLVEAGRKAGLTDEQIIKLSEENEDALVRIAQMQAALQDNKQPGQEPDKGKEPKGAQETPAQEGPRLKKVELDFDKLALDEEGENEVKQLQDSFNSMVDYLEEIKGKIDQSQEGLERVRQREVQETQRMVVDFFDQAGQTHPEFGISDKGLSKQQFELRDQAVKHAYALQQVYKLGDKEALAMGFNAALGALSQNKVSQRIVQGLHKQRSQSSVRPDASRRIGSPKKGMEAALERMDEILGR